MVKGILRTVLAFLGPAAVITNTELQYSDTSVREDLTDVIYNIAPDETPFMTDIGRATARDVLHEWQVDDLEARDTNNAHLEGDDVDSFDPVERPDRIGNYVQISRKTIIVGGTTEAVNHAGIKSVKGYQLAKKGKALRLDMEAIMLSNQGAVAGSAATPRKTGSLLAFLKTNVDKAGDGADPVWTTVPTVARTDGTQRAFTENMLKSVIQSMYTNGAKLVKLSVGPFNKQVVSGFQGIATKTFNINAPRTAAIVAAADVYVSDFGTLQVVPNRNQRDRDAILYDPEFLSTMFLRPFKKENLAKTGDADKTMLIVEWGLKVHNEAAHGLVADLTTS